MSEAIIAREWFSKETGEPVSSISPLGSGTSNAIFRINGEFVVRIKRANETDAPFQNPRGEKEILTALKKSHPTIAPSLLFYDEKTGNKIERFVPGKPFRSPSGSLDPREDLRSAIDSLKALHSVKGSFPAFDLFSRKKRYEEGAADFLAASDAFEAEYPPPPEPCPETDWVLCHNDLHEGNLRIDSEGRCVLLDFEFAGMNDPAFDLASLLEENLILEAEAKEAIRRYYGNTWSEEKERRVFAWIAYEHVFWRNWAICRYLETKNPEFLEIARIKEKAANKK